MKTILIIKNSYKLNSNFSIKNTAYTNAGTKVKVSLQQKDRVNANMCLVFSSFDSGPCVACLVRMRDEVLLCVVHYWFFYKLAVF